ncbi:MAG: endolytic transglycosylase MltG [Alphaproteobacteria bacterium]|nr:endolytic transglycosylase MltG [Alphaproteobacteria bacterium]
MARAAVRRSSGGGGFFSFLFWIAVLAGAAALFGFFYFTSAIGRPGPFAEARTFVVERGTSGAGIAEKLEAEGFISDALLFRIANRLQGGATLQAGEYEIPANASTRQIVDLMTSGDALQHAVTFPEGITIAAVMRILEESDVLTGDMPAAPPEGSILPDTYHVARGMTREALLQQMRDARDEAVNEIWAARAPNLPLATPDDLVNLAAIVERETGVASERPLVAAVFINRLRRPMRLETDPTIIYGVCLRHPDRCRDGRLVDAQGNRRTIRQSEIDMNTGYNTYRIDGLPPTPIANPGRAALEATAHPAESNALFFVADGTGGHVFASTLAEHQANVVRWREIEAQRLAAERAGR